MKLSKTKISQHYSKLVFGFILIAIITLFAVLYFAFSKTTLTLTAKPQEVATKLEVALAAAKGQILTTELETTGTYSDLSGTKTVEDYATGTVTLVNNYVADQSMIATTRLLSTEGVLFRTQEDVTVPKGKSITITVKADQPGKSGDIGPSKFEIVALNSAKKDQIYGESTAAMTGGEKKLAVISETDLAQADAQILEPLKAQASEKLQAQLALLEEPNLTLDQNSLISEIISSEYSGEPGEEAATLECKYKVKIIGVAVDKQELIKLGRAKAQETISSDLILLTDSAAEQASYTIKEGTINEQSATLSVTYSGQTKIHADASFLDKSKLIGKTEGEVMSYFKDYPEVAEVKIQFSPAWISTIPRFENNIKIVVE